MNRRRLLVGGGALALAGASYAGLKRTGSMVAYDASVAQTRAALAGTPEFRDLVRYATLAPNGYNTQPWRFRTHTNGTQILPDFSRRTPAVDPDDHHLFVSLGCAVENLAIAATSRGQPGTIIFNAESDSSVMFAFGGERAAEPALFDALPRRHRREMSSTVGRLAPMTCGP